jgi:hypothetical protein
VPILGRLDVANSWDACCRHTTWRADDMPKSAATINDPPTLTTDMAAMEVELELRAQLAEFRGRLSRIAAALHAIGPDQPPSTVPPYR